MDNNFASQNFIPKEPGSSAQSFGPKRRDSHGIFYTIGNILFFLSILLAIGVFGYEKYLGNSISKMEAGLTQAREALDPATITELAKANNRISSAEQVLSKHTTISTFFKLLEQLTLKSLRFTTFSYINNDGNIQIQMDGEARDYKTVALQSDIFSNNTYFNGSNFSNLDLNEKGDVVFSFKTGLDRNLILYLNQFESISPASTQVPVEQGTTGSASEPNQQETQ